MSRPNIVFVLSDDHASHSISAYGSRLAQTPQIDRLAEEGMRFDNVFCANSICTPSRATILTGQHSHVNGVRTLDDALDNTRETLPKILQRDGYQTAMVGKWHLGHGPQHDPRGFDFWEILPGQGRYHDPEFITPEGTAVREGYVTDLVTDIGLDWMRSRDRDRPFALFLHHKAVHSPWEPAERHEGLFTGDLPEPETLWDDYEGRPAAAAAVRMRIETMPPYHVKQQPPPGVDAADLLDWWTAQADPPDLADRGWKYHAFVRDYLRCAAAIDENVGRLLDFLDEDDIAGNTIVIYTSDQGFFLGDHGWFDKRFMYEESLRMPFLLRWPEAVAPGSVNTDMISNVDFAPTLLEAAGIDVPGQLQGRSFAQSLDGASPEDWPESIYYRYWMTPNVHDVAPHYGIRTSRYKLIRFDVTALPDLDAAGEWELYDLDSDPREMRNVYGDPAYRDVQDDLMRELTRRRAAVDDVDDYPQAPTGAPGAVGGHIDRPGYAAHRQSALKQLEALVRSRNGNGPSAGG